MKVIFPALFLLTIQMVIAQNIGINTNNPQELLHLRSDSIRTALRLDNKKSSSGGFNYFSSVAQPTGVQNFVISTGYKNWTDLVNAKITNSDNVRLEGPALNVSEYANGLRINFALSNSVPSTAQIGDITFNMEARRFGTFSGPYSYLLFMYKASNNQPLARFTNFNNILTSSTDITSSFIQIETYSTITADILNLQDYYFVIGPSFSPVNGQSRMEIDRIFLEIEYRMPANGTENVFWSAGAKDGTFIVANSNNLNSNEYLRIDETGTTALKALKITKNAGPGKVLTSNAEGKAFWADIPQQEMDLLWLNKQDTAFYANGPVQVNNNIGQPAIIFDKGENRLNNGINFAETDNRLFNVIIDANDDQSNEQFNIYKDNTEALAQNPAVRFNLGGNDSWINGGGNLGVGTDTPQQKLSTIGTIRAANDVTETEFIEMTHDGNNALINTVGDGKLIIQHDGVQKMTIQDDGKVGIGYLDPVERLDVNGAIKIGSTSNTTTQAGTIRWNPTTKNFEGFTGVKWLSLTTNKGWGNTGGNENQSFTTEPSGQNFGFSVDIHENTAAVVSHISDSLYIFNYNSNEWIKVAAFEDHRINVNISQNYIVTEGGSINIYEFSNGSWSLQQTIFNGVDPVNSADIHGNTLVFGIEALNQAKIFVKNGANWTFEAILTPSNGQSGDDFGRSVSIFNDRVIVGAPVRNNAEGAVYVFNRVGTVWTEEIMITASDGENADFFGHNIDLKGNSFIVGSYSKNQNSIFSSGGAYVYKKNGGIWNETILPFSYYDNNSFCGLAVKLNGAANLAVVGCPEIINLISGNGYGNGRVHVFALDGSTWGEEIILTASDGALSDGFGHSTSIHGEHIIIGAPGKNSNNDGKVYFFKNH